MIKRFEIATISLLLLMSAACSGKPGSGPAMLTKAESSVGEISTDELDEKGKVVISYHMGPFDLSSDTSPEEMIEDPGRINFRVDEPMWITSFEPSVVDEEGNPLPSNLVHHIILINHGEENTFCTTKQTGNPFAAATSSLKKIELPEGHGYAVIPSDGLEARVVLKNPTNQNHFGVYVKFNLTGEPMTSAKNITDVKPMMIDVDPCEHKPISLAPGQFIEKNALAYSPEDGALIKAYGLLQNYGVSIAMNTNGDDPFWQGVASISNEYEILELPPFEDPAGVEIKKGDSINLTVAYDNTSSNWYDGATGAAIIYLAREKGNGKDTAIIKSAAVSKSSAVEVQSSLLH